MGEKEAVWIERRRVGAETTKGNALQREAI